MYDAQTRQWSLVTPNQEWKDGEVCISVHECCWRVLLVMLSSIHIACRACCSVSRCRSQSKAFCPPHYSMHTIANLELMLRSASQHVVYVLLDHTLQSYIHSAGHPLSLHGSVTLVSMSCSGFTQANCCLHWGYSSKLLLTQVSSPVELEQCDEETLAAILGTHAKASICLLCATGIAISHPILFHDMSSAVAKICMADICL